MEADISDILITAEQLQSRNRELASELSRDFDGHHLAVIILSNGSLFFAADLLRHVTLPLELDVIGVKSYDGTESTGNVVVLSELNLDLNGRTVLVIDDIFDSGLTMETICEELKRHQPAAIKTCVLLHKDRPRELKRVPDYVGFPVADQFVVGYGLDFNERYRNLPYIGVLHEHLYAPENDAILTSA